MLKQTVNYTDFDDMPCEETLYFNISRSEITSSREFREELENVIKTFDGVSKAFEGEKRDLTPDEILTMMDVIKVFIKLSYGHRSADGKKFSKSPEIWKDFMDTAAYDEFLMSIFQNPEKMYAFIFGIVPPQIRDDVQANARKNQPELFSQIDATSDIATDSTPEPAKTEQDDRPAWIRENRAPNKAELIFMSEAEIAEAYRQRVTAS